MKIAFISDIHGNATALEAVLADIEKNNVDQIAILGDLCYRGPEPKRVLEMIKSLNAKVIKGNVDEWVVRGFRDGEVPEANLEMMKKEREWTLSQLSDNDLEYLKNLPRELTLDLNEKHKVHAFHATPTSLFDIVRPHDSNEVLIEKLMKNEDATIFLYGHIHVPYVRFIEGKCVANLGSVGMSLDGSNDASYLILEEDGDSFQISIRRVAYNIEKVKRKLKELEYPNIEFLHGVLDKAGWVG